MVKEVISSPAVMLMLENINGAKLKAMGNTYGSMAILILVNSTTE